jgi:hypothetical protein
MCPTTTTLFYIIVNLYFRPFLDSIIIANEFCVWGHQRLVYLVIALFWLSVETPPDLTGNAACVWPTATIVSNFLKDVMLCCLHLHVSCCPQPTDAVPSSNLLDLVSANLNGLHFPITTSFFRCPLSPCFFFRNSCSKFAFLYFLSVLLVQIYIWVFLLLVSMVVKILLSKQFHFRTEKAWIFPFAS